MQKNSPKWVEEMVDVVVIKAVEELMKPLVMSSDFM